MKEIDHVIRYVPTYINKDGMRTLMGPAQGRNTYEKAEDAQAYINAVLTQDGADRILADVFGSQAVGTFEVRPCECWPGHHDPKGIYFD